MENYVSLIIDIEKSRNYEIEDRNEIQFHMLSCIDKLNEYFSEQIKYKVTFSAGDELQGLFYDVTTAVMYYRLLEMLLNPVKLRAGIGVGAWTVKVDNGISTQQDGPVYHRARRAIEEVYKTQLHNVRICSEKDDFLANHLLNASNVLKSQQIHMQNNVLVVLEFLYPFTRQQIHNEKLETVMNILKAKWRFQMGKKNSDNSKTILDTSNIMLYRPIFIDGNMKNAEETIIIKNMSAIVAEMLGCSRQNVDMIIRRGNTSKIRELDYVALQYIEKIYGE